MTPKAHVNRAGGWFIPGRSQLATVLGSFLLCLTAFTSSGCENLAIGRTCQTLSMGGVNDSQWNDQALECPTRLCLKPALNGQADQGTAPFCTAECKSNKDCADGERRDRSNGSDRRCIKGWSCAVIFETGPLACQRLCVCDDFAPPSGKFPPAATCSTVK